MGLTNALWFDVVVVRCCRKTEVSGSRSRSRTEINNRKPPAGVAAAKVRRSTRPAGHQAMRGCERGNLLAFSHSPVIS